MQLITMWLSLFIATNYLMFKDLNECGFILRSQELYYC